MKVPIGSKVISSKGGRGILVEYHLGKFPKIYDLISGTVVMLDADELTLDPDQTRLVTPVYVLNSKSMSFWKMVWAIVMAEAIAGIVAGLILDVMK